MKVSRASWALIAVALVALTALWASGFFTPSVGVAMSSRSMSHDDVDLPGVLDPGERISLTGVHAPGDAVTYVEGARSGYTFGSDFGDVLSYESRVHGVNGGVGIVHRAMAWVEYNATADAYDVPSLGLSGVRAFLMDVGVFDPLGKTYVHTLLGVSLDPELAGRHAGFLTKGDHNEGFDQDARGGLEGLGPVELVEVRFVDGKVVHFVEGETAMRIGLIVLGALAVVGVVLFFARRQMLALWRRARTPGHACHACGKRIEPGDGFCPACGATTT